MADITRNNADLPTMIVGASVSGVPATPVGSDTSGNMLVKDSNAITVLNQIQTNTASAINDNVVTGTVVAVNGTVVVAAEGCYTISVAISGTWVGTLVAEGQLADSTWIGLPLYVVNPAATPYAQTFLISANGVGLITGGGYLNIRIRASVYTSGTVNISMDASLAQQTIFSAQLGNWQVSSKTQDGIGNLINSYNSQLETADIIATALISGALAVSTTALAARVSTSNLANRKLLMITPTSGTIYMGATSGVTTTTGTPIFANQTFTLSYGAAITPFLIAAASVNVIIQEGS